MLLFRSFSHLCSWRFILYLLRQKSCVDLSSSCNQHIPLSLPSKMCPETVNLLLSSGLPLWSDASHLHLSLELLTFSLGSALILLQCILFFFFGCTHGMWKFLGQVSSSHYCSDLSHSGDNTRSLTAGLPGNSVTWSCAVPLSARLEKDVTWSVK